MAKINPITGVPTRMQKPAEVLPDRVRKRKPHNIETIEARFLIGREGFAFMKVKGYGELEEAAGRIVGAYKKEEALSGRQLMWNVHLIMIRHDGRWVEQLVQIDPDFRDVGETETAMVKDLIAETMERLRGANRERGAADGEHRAPPSPRSQTNAPGSS